MTRIGIILGSTRPGRLGAAVAEWVVAQTSGRDDAEYELVDLADFDLPLLDEAIPPSLGQYQNDHTRRWAETVASFDGFVIVSGEYNHSIPGALKNALDFVYAEWNNKAVGFVSYGSAGGVRAVEHLRGVAAELQMASVRGQVSFGLATDFVNYRDFTPADDHADRLDVMLGQLVSWSKALETVRSGSLQAA